MEGTKATGSSDRANELQSYHEKCLPVLNTGLDRNYQVPMWTVLGWLQDARSEWFRNNSHLWGVRRSVVRSQSILVDRKAMFFMSSGDELKLVNEIVGRGNSSFDLITSMYAKLQSRHRGGGTGEWTPIATCNCTCVFTENLRPVKLPEVLAECNLPEKKPEFAELAKSLCLELNNAHKRETEACSKPNFVYKFKVSYSHEDINSHLNQANYFRYVYDAQTFAIEDKTVEERLHHLLTNHPRAVAVDYKQELTARGGEYECHLYLVAHNEVHAVFRQDNATLFRAVYLYDPLPRPGTSKL
eukprot:Clim_evm13s46 gene=Clim_evmTU13s46